MNYPNSIKNLIECYKKLPGVGEKTAERLALATLKLNDDTIDLFSKSIRDCKIKTKKCEICNSFSENDICDICQDKTRDSKILCVLEEPKNVYLFEKIGTYTGKYYVLDGLISPLEGIGPEDVGVYKLIELIKKESITEVILALKPSLEGETTSLYISKSLEKDDVLVSRIAQGIPMYTDIDYIDTLTLEKALNDRKKISDNN